MTREPALIIGTIAAIIVLVAQQALAAQVISSDGAIKWANLIVSLTPLLAALVIRFFVSPAEKPGL